MGYDRLTADNPFLRIYMALRDLCARHREISFQFLDLTEVEERASWLLGLSPMLGVRRSGDVITADDFFEAIDRLDRDRELVKELKRENRIQQLVRAEREKWEKERIKVFRKSLQGCIQRQPREQAGW